MTMITAKDVQELLAVGGSACVSIYMPTHRAGRERQQDRVRLKGLIDEAERRLVGRGMRTVDARELLASLRGLLDHSGFWRKPGDGLALFVAPGIVRTFRIPYRFEPLVVDAERFHIKPLLELLSGDGRFFILALSQNQVRLFLGTRHSVSEVEMEDIPTSLAETLPTGRPKGQLQMHTTGRAGGRGGRIPSVLHGHGIGEEESKEDIVRYLRVLDTELAGLLGDQRAPLILAAVDFLHPLYRQVSNWPGLVEEGIIGNPDRLSAARLHHQAWEIMEPRFRAAQRDAAAEFQKRLGTGLASADLRTVLQAAMEGRVSVLFAAAGTQLWGRFDAGAGSLELHDQAQAQDGDLIDLAAVSTLVHGGEVYVVEKDQLPGGASMAAVLRFANISPAGSPAETS